jgi:hypothetical protein
MADATGFVGGRWLAGMLSSGKLDSQDSERSTRGLPWRSVQENGRFRAPGHR